VRSLSPKGEIRRSAAVVASGRASEGVDEHGEPIAVGDSLRDRLMERERRQRRDPDAFIPDEIFGDLGALTTHGHNTEGSHD
jgi:mannitol 2-dehydrogenase